MPQHLLLPQVRPRVTMRRHRQCPAPAAANSGRRRWRSCGFTYDGQTHPAAAGFSPAGLAADRQTHTAAGPWPSGWQWRWTLGRRPGVPSRGPARTGSPYPPSTRGAPVTGAAQPAGHRSLVGREGQVADQPGPVVRAARPWAVMVLPAMGGPPPRSGPGGPPRTGAPGGPGGRPGGPGGPACGPAALVRWVAHT